MNVGCFVDPHFRSSGLKQDISFAFGLPRLLTVPALARGSADKADKCDPTNRLRNVQEVKLMDPRMDLDSLVVLV